MTNSAGRSNRGAEPERWWRGLLVAGALGASFLGSELIARQDTARPSEPAPTVLTVPMRQADGTLDEQRLELAPIPTAIPRSEVSTIARSRSSR